MAIGSALAVTLAYVGVNQHYRGLVDEKLRQLKARGIPMAGANLAPPVPDGGNAAPLYLRVAAIANPCAVGTEATCAPRRA